MKNMGMKRALSDFDGDYAPEIGTRGPHANYYADNSSF